MAGIKEYLSHLRDVAQRVETDLLRVIQSIFQSYEAIDIIETLNLYPRGLTYHIAPALFDVDALGLPQQDRPDPTVVDLGQYVASDLTGNVVITQSTTSVLLNGLNGTFTVSVADIVAAGPSGYTYRSIRPSSFTYNCIIKINENTLTIDVVLDDTLSQLNVSFDSVTFQVSDLKPGPAQADKSNIIIVGEWKLTS